jgi:hypothetical protein
VQAFANLKGDKAAQLREARSKYYAMITRIDANVGRVLHHLDELDLHENTAVVFACDNGWALGDHGLYGKGPFFYEELIRGPLLIRYPKLSGAGTRIERVVSLVDLAPTLCELAGLTPPVTMHGRSLLNLIRYPESTRHADERFLEYDEQKGKPYPARGIVTKRYKFIDYLKDTHDVLYDLERDPDEMHNVVNDFHYDGLAEVLRNRIELWRSRTEDPSYEKPRTATVAPPARPTPPARPERPTPPPRPTRHLPPKRSGRPTSPRRTATPVPPEPSKPPEQLEPPELPDPPEEQPSEQPEPPGLPEPPEEEPSEQPEPPELPEPPEEEPPEQPEPPELPEPPEEQPPEQPEEQQPEQPSRPIDTPG